MTEQGCHDRGLPSSNSPNLPNITSGTERSGTGVDVTQKLREAVAEGRSLKINKNSGQVQGSKLGLTKNEFADYVNKTSTDLNPSKSGTDGKYDDSLGERLQQTKHSLALAFGITKDRMPRLSPLPKPKTKVFSRQSQRHNGNYASPKASANTPTRSSINEELRLTKESLSEANAHLSEAVRITAANISETSSHVGQKVTDGANTAFSATIQAGKKLRDFKEAIGEAAGQTSQKFDSAKAVISDATTSTTANASKLVATVSGDGGEHGKIRRDAQNAPYAHDKQEGSKLQ
ncbi:hypothetical protein HDU83_000882 [Entophlyctis luteolus]|nr:hypothetical protein HDU83_000882 [Entophlyctis luteolus]